MKKSSPLKLNVEELKKLTQTEVDSVVGGSYTQYCLSVAGCGGGVTSGIGARGGSRGSSAC